jgi:hypothetical protein
MSDHTAGDHDVHNVHRTPKAEFYVYFALIFVLAIPFATAIWAWSLISERRLPVHGPLARAWREAGAVTPSIFRP